MKRHATIVERHLAAQAEGFAPLVYVVRTESGYWTFPAERWVGFLERKAAGEAVGGAIWGHARHTLKKPSGRRIHDIRGWGDAEYRAALDAARREMNR